MINAAATAPVKVTFPLNQPGSQIAGLINTVNGRLDTNEANITTLQNQVATLQSTVTDLQNQINALTTRMTTAENNISTINAHQNTQDQSIADLNTRVTALEGEMAPKTGPYIGDMVHVKDTHGHCQPSIVYEDWDGKNAAGTISVAVLSPIRLSESPWDSYLEVHQSSGNDPPFTAWHWPEMAFQYRRDLFERIVARAG